jgi:formate-dependent nitrite reductase membrane component NrfD
MIELLVTTLPPHWGWEVVLYFFLGGIAGGAYFMATLLRLAGSPEDRPVVRLGYYVAFPLILICALLLITDLKQPLRFLNMLFAFKQPGISFKYWSPISFGSWILFLFGVFSFLSFVGVLGEDRRIQSGLAHRYGRWLADNPLGLAVAIVGSLFASGFAGYVGLDLATSNQPVWSQTPLLGALFLCSAVSTALAAMVVLMRWRRVGVPGSELRLRTANTFMLAAVLVVLVAMLATLGSQAQPLWAGLYAVLLIVGVVAIGLVAPLVLQLMPGVLGRRTAESAVIASGLVLVGGLLLRWVTVIAPQGL